MKQRISHKACVAEICRVCTQMAIAAKAGYCVKLNGQYVYVDVAAWLNGRFVAVEVETTVRNVGFTVAKARQLGAILWIVVPRRKLRGQMTHKLKKLGICCNNGRFKVLVHSQVEQELTNYLSQSKPANC